jgi:hypothetical protein
MAFVGRRHDGETTSSLPHRIDATENGLICGYGNLSSKIMVIHNNNERAEWKPQIDTSRVVTSPLSAPWTGALDGESREITNRSKVTAHRTTKFNASLFSCQRLLDLGDGSTESGS